MTGHFPITIAMNTNESSKIQKQQQRRNNKSKINVA